MALIKTKIDTRSDAFQKNKAAYEAMVGTLRERQAYAVSGGRDKQIERNHERGKFLPRERIDMLIDPHTPFLELSTLAAWDKYKNAAQSAGIVTGIGIVTGTPCVIIANDPTVKGGTFFPETVQKHIRAQEIALQNRLPVVYLVDSGGAFLPHQDEVFSGPRHFGHTFYLQARLSAQGLTQLSAVFGGSTAGGAYIPVLCDYVVMVRGKGRIFLGGPPIVKEAIKEIVDQETLGGAEKHTRVSGVSDDFADSEPEALGKLREAIARLNWRRQVHAKTKPAKPPRYATEELLGIVPVDRKQVFDMYEVIARLIDDSDFDEFKPHFGEELVCGVAYIHGYPVGIIANNGILFSECSLKGTHFIEKCNQRNIPLLFLHNITGFMVGTKAEESGIAKHSSKMVYAVANSRVPKYSVIVSHSCGAGNYGMCGAGLMPHFLFTWPTSFIATMAGETAVVVMTEVKKAGIGGDKVTQAELDKIAEDTRALYTEQGDPYHITARLWDDGLIEPTKTRDILGLCLALGATLEPETGYHPVYRM
ncbi:MAG: methylcrotonoyl-CoA carboxylase [Alphaproteobacteria bacterium]|nr:methylcrotonoyl-CoA carboxylase [Alphaproteobacteria bacterium]